MNEREIRELASEYMVGVDVVRELAQVYEDSSLVEEGLRDYLDELAEFGYGRGGGYD